MNKLQVAIVERGILADVLRGVGNSRVRIANLRGGKLPVGLRTPCVGVGYVDAHSQILPHFIVVPDTDRREFFAWVNTYCPFATPLTQWCRVVSEEELARVQSLEVAPRYGCAVSAWAGAILGEAILHSGTGSTLSQLPVTALQSCASFVAARAFGLWGLGKARSASMRRHESARGILGIANRGPNLVEYQQLWFVLETLSGEVRTRSLDEDWQFQLIIESCEDIRKTGFVSRPTVSNVMKELGWSENLAEFERSGAEQRVALFDHAAENLARFESGARQTSKVLAEFTVAYLAARIGGSASAHISLLEKLVDNYPMVALWYGVVSALYKPEIWGTEFDGLGRLVLKELAFPLRFDDPPRCDISFDELLALVEPGTDCQSLRFRGATRRALNVEVALGVSAMIPLSGLPAQDSAGVADGIAPSELVRIDRHLTAATEEIARLRDAYGQSVPDRSLKSRRQSKKNPPQSRKRRKDDEFDDGRQLPFESS